MYSLAPINLHTEGNFVNANNSNLSKPIVTEFTRKRGCNFALGQQPMQNVCIVKLQLLDQYFFINPVLFICINCSILSPKNKKSFKFQTIRLFLRDVKSGTF